MENEQMEQETILLPESAPYGVPAEQMAEGYRAFQKKFLRRGFCIRVGLVLFCLADFLGVAIWRFVNGRSVNSMTYVLIVLCAALLFVLWYNPKKAARPGDLRIDYEIRDLRQLYDLAVGKTSLQIMTWESLSLRTMPKAGRSRSIRTGTGAAAEFGAALWRADRFGTASLLSAVFQKRMHLYHLEICLFGRAAPASKQHTPGKCGRLSTAFGINKARNYNNG